MDRTTNGVGVDVVADAATTHGAYTLIDARLAAGASLDPHVVERETIALWVLAGALTVVVDGVPHALAPGDHLRLAPRLPRALRATTDARVLGLIVPAISARLALAAADRSLSADDRAAWLAAADVRLLPRLLWGDGEPAAGPAPGAPPTPALRPSVGHGLGSAPDAAARARTEARAMTARQPHHHLPAPPATDHADHQEPIA